MTDTPTIPTVPIAMLVAAGLVSFAPGFWMPSPGPVVSLSSLVVFVANRAVDRMLEPGATGAFAGASLMVVALIVAAVSGTFATIRSERTWLKCERWSRGGRRMRVQRGCWVSD